MSCSLQVYECFGPAVTARFKKFHSLRLRPPNLPNFSSFYRDYTVLPVCLNTGRRHWSAGSGTTLWTACCKVESEPKSSNCNRLFSSTASGEVCKEKWVSEVRGRHHVTRSSFIPSPCIIDEMEEEKHHAG